MTITVDEALKWIRSHNETDAEQARAEAVAAEVERLRVDLTCAQASYVSARDAALAAESRLKWFEEREPLVRKHVDHCWFEKGEAVQDWEEANPKPHDPDELDKHLASQIETTLTEWAENWRAFEQPPAAAKPSFRYNDLSAFKPSPEFEAAIKKALDQFHAWRCPKCGAPGRLYWNPSTGVDTFFLVDGLPRLSDAVRPSILCSKGCQPEPAASM